VALLHGSKMARARPTPIRKITAPGSCRASRAGPSC
jgi:hypothetical protein